MIASGVNSSGHYRRGGMLRGLAWIAAAIGLLLLAGGLLMKWDDSGDIKEKIKQTYERTRKHLTGKSTPTGTRTDTGTKDDNEQVTPPPVGDKDDGKDGTKTGDDSGDKKTLETPETPEKPYTVKNPPPVVKTWHLVEEGDTLFGIAETYYENGKLWKLIAKANGLKDPSELKKGMELLIPGR
jgi:nucleoid-associated protein YgaU